MSGEDSTGFSAGRLPLGLAEVSVLEKIEAGEADDIVVREEKFRAIFTRSRNSFTNDRRDRA